MKKIIAIGDIHGRTKWKDIVSQHPDDITVFLGDYGDPYEPRNNEDTISNLRDIIEFKHNNPERVVLLLGNHDMHYLFFNDFPRGSRYERNLLYTYSDIFEENREDFLYAWHYENYLFTHAGVTNAWWYESFRGELVKSAESVANQLNNPSPTQLRTMFQIGYSRGGFSKNSGIFWADKEETIQDPLEEVHQVVGHTRTKDIITSAKSEDTSITYCDCLEHGLYFKIS